MLLVLLLLLLLLGDGVSEVRVQKFENFVLDLGLVGRGLRLLGRELAFMLGRLLLLLLLLMVLEWVSTPLDW